MARYLIPLVILALVIYFLLPGGDDASEIESVLDKVLEAGRNKDSGAVLDNFSLYYKDEYGLSYPAIKQIIGKRFESFDGFDGEYSSLSVSFKENEEGEREALANVDVIVYGLRSGTPYALIGSEDAPENITIKLVKSALGGWKITAVSGVDEGYSEY